MKTDRMTNVLALLLATGLANAVAAPDPEARHEKTFRNLSVSVPRLAQAPTLDGTVDPTEWAGAGMAPRMVGFEGEDRLLDEKQKFYFAYTDDPPSPNDGLRRTGALWVAWQIQRPKDAIAPKAIITEPDKSFWHTDDALEFMINCRPHSKHRKIGRDFYMIWNALGTKYDRREGFESETAEGIRWNGDWKAVSRTVPDFGWEGEARFPLATLEDAEKPGPGVSWIFQLAENRATPEPLVATAGYQISWFEARDYPTFLFTGPDGVFVRVLDSGPMAEAGKGGMVLELVNPGTTARTVTPTLKFYKRKPDAPSPLPYLRAFDQGRDRPEDRAGGGKVALFIPDEQVSKQLLDENYTLIKEQKEPVTLAPGERKQIDFTVAKEHDDYLLIYDVRDADGKVIAGGPLPFVVPEPLAVTTRSFYLVDKSIAVKADLRYVTGWDATGKLTAKFSADKTLFEKEWSGEQARSKLEFDLPIRNVAPGKYQLELVATDGSRKKLGERRTEITIPETPEWLSKPVGMRPVVPKPWTPIKVSGSKLSFLMGEYQLKDSVLPSEINVRSVFDEKREPILRGPMRLHGIVDGKTVEWRGSVKLGEKRGELVRASSTATAGKVAISATAEFEHDGMEKITLTVSPAAGQPAVSELTLSVPFAKGFADLYRPNRAIIHPDKLVVKPGALPAAGVAHDWRPAVWIGNTRRGLDWFAENWKGWRTDADFVTKAIEVENGPDGATLHVHFIRMKPDKPLVLDKPREIVFGLMFTPMRTLNPEPVRIGTGYYSDEHKNKLAADVAAGINCVEVWNHHDWANPNKLLQGWPDQTPERSAELAGLAKPLHERDVKVIPYSGWGISRNAQVYPTWGGEMVAEPRVDIGLRCDAVCWNTPIIEAYLWQMRKASLESGYDGFRMDNGFSVSICSSLKHHGHGSACGWRDDSGNVQPSLCIFGAREASKRAYRMYHSQDITENGVCIQAIHGGVRFAAILSHSDAGLSSEGAEMMAHSSKEFDISFWRANLMEDRYGLQVIYGPKAERLGNDTRLGLGAIHRLTPRGVHFVEWQEHGYSRAARPSVFVAQAEDWVGWLTPGTEFYGYWENSQFLQTGHPELYGSFHVRRGDKLLLALFNHETTPVEQTIRLDLKALGFKGDVHALDAVLDESIAIKDGGMTLSFAPEGFRLIKIAAKPFDVIEPKKISDNLISELDPSKWPAQGVPAGWNGSGDAGAVAAVNGEIVIQGKVGKPVGVGRSVPLAADKHYLMEAEVRVDADEGVHLGPEADPHKFEIVFGGFYYPRRTLGSESLPGRYETLRIYWTTTKDNPAATARLSLNGNGKVFIRRIGVYEVDRVDRR